jgi:hypothetical protein
VTEKIKKLPKWAQQHINMLESDRFRLDSVLRHKDRLLEMFEEQQEPRRLWCEDILSGTRLYLPVDRVHYQLREDDSGWGRGILEVGFNTTNHDEDALVVTSQAQHIDVSPVVSNQLEIRLRKDK